MALDIYIKYDDYKKYCIADPVSEDEFKKLRVRAQAKIDYYTWNRLKKYEKYDDLPEEVKISVAQFIDFLKAYPVSMGTGVLSGYSNGIETFSYTIDTANPVKALNNVLWNCLKENLVAYPELLYRGVSCD